MIWIAVDAMGGDEAPGHIVGGALADYVDRRQMVRATEALLAAGGKTSIADASRLGARSLK
jgi:fatty acid/phospholipid biosynthesis enzyme